MENHEWTFWPTQYIGKIYYKEKIHAILETKKSYNLQSENWKPVSGMILYQIWGPGQLMM